jgi:hypothetical protein
MNHKLMRLLIVFFLTTILFSCENDPKLPDNLLGFEAEVVGISAEENSLDIHLNLSRPVSQDISVLVGVVATGIQYGTDFTTSPEAVNNNISLTIPAGETQATIVLTKGNGVGFTGDESIVFAIGIVMSGSSLPVISSIPQTTVSFSEITVNSASMDIQGGGALFPNKVFIDLSANRQTVVNRTAWDFGFSSGDDFRAILNTSNGMMARAINKTDLNAVTAADTVGFGAQLSIAAVFAGITSTPTPAWTSTAIAWIDDPAGDLTKTAIAAISATASENKVYIVNKGDGPGLPATKLGWKKIRVIRNGSGYTLQHADINATTFSEIQITKNTSHAFQYVSLATGAVSVEPETKKWDIAWTGFTNSTNFGSGPVPYYFQDVVLQNTSGVQTLQILTSVKTYEAFAESDLAAIDFGVQSQTKIGTNWRSGGGPGVAPALRTDRFYLIKDGDGNIYKLKFTALTQNGERGKPAIEFTLLKKGV